jgi:ribosome-associated translation inhibitor RaiA
MEVRVETHHVSLPRNNRASLAARIGRVFARFSDHVTQLRVTLKDVNGPKGGRDKVCVLSADLQGGGQVVVVDRADKMRSAIFGCLRRARSVVSRELRRRRLRGRMGIDRRLQMPA